MNGLFDDNAKRRISSDAALAIDALQAIIKECGQKFSFKYYVKEKIERARIVVDCIANEAEEGE